MLDLDAELEEYIGLHSEPEPEILQQLSRATHQKILIINLQQTMRE